MKRHILITLMLLISQILTAQTTLKDQLTAVHEAFGVNFVYDSSLDLEQIAGHAGNDDLSSRHYGHSGYSRHSRLDRESLHECLDALLSGTGIDWEIRKRYVVLTGKGKKSGYAILIKSQVDTLEESRITAHASDMERRSSTGLKRIDSRDIDKGFSFMSSPDLIKTIQSLPGVASGTELLSGLYVHGGDGSDNLFLLDGVPIYQAGHMGGLFSSFNPDIVKQVDFYKSGFPARYGGRLSSVIDSRSSTGDMYEYHGTMSIGLIDGRVQLEGPLVQGKTSFNLALRRSWLDAVTLPAFSIINAGKENQRHDFRYAFQDFNAVVSHRFSEDNILELKAYYGKDNLRIDYMVRDYNSDIERMSHQSSDMDIRWGNFLATLIWKKRLAEDLEINSALYHTRGTSGLDIITSSKGWDDPVVGTYEEDYTSLTATSAAKADFTYKGISDLLLDFGASYQFHEFAPEREFANTSWRYDGSKSQTGNSESSYQNGHEAAMYADGFLRMTDWFSVHAGLRYVLFGVKDKVRHRLEPRVSTRFDIGGNGRLDLSYTEMNQFSHQISTSYLDLPTEFWMPSTQRLAPMFSRQVAAEYSHRFPFGMDMKLGGWYKTMDNLTEQWNSYSYIPPVTNWDQSVITGKGRSYGLESEVEYTGKKLSLAAYYTLSWSERRFEELWYEWYPDKNDNRHKINLMCSYRFSDRFDVYAGWNFHSGNRVTVVSYKDDRYGTIIYRFGSPNNMRLPDYHRLDIGLNFRRTTRKGNHSIWNLSVYNAYCRMNAMFAQMQIFTDSDRSVSYGLVPIIPSFSYTLKF